MNSQVDNTSTDKDLEPTESLVEWLDSTIKSTIVKNDKPSAAIGIIKDGKIYYNDGFGTISRNSEKSVTSSSVFQIASVSKMFTGIIVANLIEEGKLKLDEKIITYLEEVLTDVTKSAFSEITLAHLMQHRAGIPNYGCSVYLKAKEGGNYYWEKGYSRKEFISDINKMKLEFVPGTDQSYSNSGYNIVGLILEEVTGKSYDELVRHYLVKPLELKNTFTKPTDKERTLIVTAYPPSEPKRASKISDWGYATPASGIFSSINDLQKLMDKQIDAYKVFEKTGELSPFVLLNRPGLDNTLEFNYGLGFFERKGPNGEVLFQHDGDADGYTIFYTIDPSKNLGKILITSSGGDWFLELDNKIEKKIFNWFKK
ncbi:MAG: beta-lactamase family protein [Chloroflexia bacterium]|nr:beta-lactamase family protein [Chloroflexia bacterium]